MYFTTETSGLFYSENRRDASPSFTQVTNYPFRQPERVFFNPYDSNEVWVSSFGNGMTVGITGSEPPQKPEAVMLISPAHHSNVDSLTVQLRWSKAPHALSYNVAVSTTPNFTAPTTIEMNIVDTSISSSLLVTLTHNTTYYWRVLSTNGTDNSAWSEVWDFTTPAPIILPDTVTLVYPPDQSMPVVHVDAMPPYGITLRWNRVNDAAEYIVQIGPDARMTDGVVQSTTTDTTYVFQADRDSSYWWRVRASDLKELGEWSELWMFSKVTYMDVPTEEIHRPFFSVNPNPSAGIFDLTYTLMNAADLSLYIYDVLGKKVYQLSFNHRSLGEHTERVTLPELAAVRPAVHIHL